MTNLTLTYQPADTSVLVTWVDDDNTLTTDDGSLLYLLSYNISITDTDILLVSTNITLNASLLSSTDFFSHELSEEFLVGGVTLGLLVVVCSFDQVSPPLEEWLETGGGEGLSNLLSIVEASGGEGETGQKE